MAATKRKQRPKRDAHLRQTDLSLETGVSNARVRLGKNLRRWREYREISQNALAEAVELGQATVSQMEKGRYAPGFESLVRFAHALKTTPSELLRAVKL